MKLCLIGDGNSIHIRRWAEWFLAKGNEVDMISLTRGDTWKWSRYAEVHTKPGPLGYTRNILPIREIVAKWQPDIVHGHYLTAAGFYAAMSGGRKIVVSAWGSDVYKDAQDKYKRWCIKYALKHSDLVIGDSDHLVRAVKSLVPSCRAEKVIFGIDTEKFKPEPIPHEKFRFLSIRATAPIYNPMVIVEAFEMLNMDAYLWLYRPSAECQDVEDYVNARPELKAKIVWVDRLTYDEMPRLYNSVDCGISIPNWDSNSTAMMECMACGVPVVVGYIPQNEELILDAHTWEGGNSFFWDDDYDLPDEDTLSECLKRAYESQMLKDGHGQRGFNARKTIIEKGNYQVEMTKAEKMYKEILEG